MTELPLVTRVGRAMMLAAIALLLFEAGLPILGGTPDLTIIANAFFFGILGTLLRIYSIEKRMTEMRK